MTFQCNNADCKRTFDLPARIEVMTKEETPNFRMTSSTTTKYRTVVTPCCPFCESIDFKKLQLQPIEIEPVEVRE